MPSSFERYMKSFPAFENSLKNNCIFCAVLKSDSVKKIVTILCYPIIIFFDKFLFQIPDPQYQEHFKKVHYVSVF